MYLPRTAEKEIRSLSEDFKVVLVSGMRQVGKSTLLKHLSEGTREYVTLDNGNDKALAETSPEVFFLQHPLPLVIDEIQRVPPLFLQVKYEVDKEDKTGEVWLSGSQRFALMAGVGDSLVGRLYELQLMPLSLYERQGKGLQQEEYLPAIRPKQVLSAVSDDELWQLIWQGAWPAVINKQGKSRTQFYEGFIRTFLDRDVQEWGGVEKTSDFRKFMQALAARTGQELRINKLSELTGVTDRTAKRWLFVAEAAGLIYLLPSFSTNVTKTLTKAPKLYMTDTGLAAYLCGRSTPAALRQDTNAGAFFETFVVTELLKSWRHNGIEPRFYYFRNAVTQAEIDLLIEHEGIIHPIEIKMAHRADYSMIRHFDELKKLHVTVGMGAVICMTPETRILTKDVVAHSLWNI